MNFVTFNVKPFLKYENKWCETMNYFNPYLDPFENRLSSKMSYSDGEAYDNFPDYNWIYDKLVIAKSQGLMSGKLEELNYKTLDNIKFPIFKTTYNLSFLHDWVLKFKILKQSRLCINLLFTDNFLVFYKLSFLKILINREKLTNNIYLMI